MGYGPVHGCFCRALTDLVALKAASVRTRHRFTHEGRTENGFIARRDDPFDDTLGIEVVVAAGVEP